MVLNFMWMITDFTVANGGTRLVPGSHLSGVQPTGEPLDDEVQPDGGDCWHPDAVTRYFTRLRDRNDLGDVTVKSLRAFMDTYGQELGFSFSQVARRAGHDPSVASRHYTARVDETDRQIARALSELLGGDEL